MQQPNEEFSFQLFSDGLSFTEASQTQVFGSKPVLPVPTMEYLNQLLQDKYRLDQVCGPQARIRPPVIFFHVPRLLDYEVDRVRRAVFRLSNIVPENEEDYVECREVGRSGDNQGPIDAGPIVRLTSKLFIPVNADPAFNYIGRILGPRGSTVKQLEQQTGCKILVRGGSGQRNRPTPDSTASGRAAGGGRNRDGSPSSLESDQSSEEPLHILITSRDTYEAAHRKLMMAADRIKRLLVPPPEGMDELKKHQLIELAILNGTYRLPPVLRRAAMLPVGQSYPGAAFGARPPPKRQSGGGADEGFEELRQQRRRSRSRRSPKSAISQNEPLSAEDLVSNLINKNEDEEQGEVQQQPMPVMEEATVPSNLTPAIDLVRSPNPQVSVPMLQYIGHTIHPSGLVTFQYDCLES